MHGLTARCIIIDDNQLDRIAMEQLVSEEPGLQLLGNFNNPLESLDLLKAGKVDLLFMDIHMPLLNGIDFLRSLSAPPLCIFTTLYPEYAPEAFDVEALDYLLKPVTRERLMRALQRAADLFEIRERSLQYGLHIETDFLLIKEGTTINKIMIPTILYLEALANYTRIVTTTQKFVTLQNLKNFLEQLPRDRFLRIHRSYAVALDKIRAVHQNEVSLQSYTLPLGKTYRQDALVAFLRYTGKPKT